MTTDPHSHWPARTPLYDEDGRLLLAFSATDDAHRDRPWADGLWRPDHVPAGEVVTAARRAFAGWAVSTSDLALVDALLDAGAVPWRHGHTMSHDLEVVPAEDPPAGLLLDSVDSSTLAELADQVGPLLFAAYPADHPDHSHETVAASVEAVHRVAEGDVLGPLLEVSTVARHDETLVGACLVVGRQGYPPDGGPWVLDIFRDPDEALRGVGRALLVESLRLCRQSGLLGLSLVVSHSNAKARALYADLGFVESSESHTVLMPAAD